MIASIMQLWPGVNPANRDKMGDHNRKIDAIMGGGRARGARRRSRAGTGGKPCE
jgi:hypothetical protein